MYREFEGIIPNLERRFRDSGSQWVKEEIQSYMTEIPCDECNGKRLSPISLAVTVGGVNIADLCDMSVVSILDFVDDLDISERDRMIAGEILNEIKSRLNFLKSVGLGYLTLSPRLSRRSLISDAARTSRDSSVSTRFCSRPLTDSIC